MKAGHKILFFILLCSTCKVFAQDMMFKKPTDLRDYQYKREASGGLRIQTNGFSLYAEYGWIKDIYMTRLLQIEYTYYIDYHQEKQGVESVYSGGSNYVFGLQNHLHTIRVSYGFEKTIADKADKNGVRLAFVAFGGIALGLLKPYYLYLADTIGGITTTAQRYSSATASRFLDPDYIAGAAPIHYGLNQMQPVVGLHIKAGLDFDWGIKDQFLKAIEAGAMLDVYYEDLPIMVNQSNHFYQLALYVAIHLGKRW